jgi:DNA-binding CsgD family transcriptional regulator
MTALDTAAPSARALRAQYRQAEGGSGRLRLLEAVARACAEEAASKPALQRAIIEAVRFLHADSGLVLALEDGGLTVMASTGQALPVGARLPLGGVLGSVLRSPSQLGLREQVESRLILQRGLTLSLELLLPMAVRGKVVGILGVLSAARLPLPTEEDLQCLRALATVIGMALPTTAPTHVRGPRREAAALLAQLTPREQQVFALLPRGCTNAEIAAELGIATGTAKIHVERILHKLGVSDRTQAAVRASECGLRG